MKLLIFLLWVFIIIINSSICNASEQKDICSIHPLYCQIIKNKESVNEKIDKNYAMELSNSIHKICRKILNKQRLQNKKSKKNKMKNKWKNCIDCDIDSKIFNAILMQESRYQLNATNCLQGLDKITHEVTIICVDFGISQINLRNIIKYDIDTKKLLTDMDYAIEQGFWILANFKNKYYSKENNYWSRYNSSNYDNRLKYENFVYKYFDINYEDKTVYKNDVMNLLQNSLLL